MQEGWINGGEKYFLLTRGISTSLTKKADTLNNICQNWHPLTM